MNPKERDDFLKRPWLDIGGRHKKKRIKIAGRWATANDQEAVEPLMTVARDRQNDYDVRLAAVQSLGAVGAGQAPCNHRCCQPGSSSRRWSRYSDRSQTL